MSHFWDLSFLSLAALFTRWYEPSDLSSLAFTLSERWILRILSLMRHIIPLSDTGNSTSTLARRFLGIISDDPMYISGLPPFSK